MFHCSLLSPAAPLMVETGIAAAGRRTLLAGGKTLNAAIEVKAAPPPARGGKLLARSAYASMANGGHPLVDGLASN
jgi:hypothetical protein